MFSQSVASLHTEKSGSVAEYGVSNITGHARKMMSRTGPGAGAGGVKGCVTVPGVLKCFSSEAFHSHLFNVKRSNTVVLDNTKPMVEDEEVAYLAGITDAIFCQTGSRGGNNALKIILKHFKGSKLVIFGGKVNLSVSRDLSFFITAGVQQDGKIEGDKNNLKIHLSGAPIPFEAVERLARGIASPSCFLSELSLDISSIGTLGIVNILAAMRVSNAIYLLFYLSV